jgi:formate hydrogenlyase subunit 3/multisubunit Na+/H+ antiporter MnhD subunit
MATYILLAPVVFLLLGAVLILFLGAEKPTEGWDPLPPSITALAFVASLLLRDELPVRVTLSRWRPLPQFRAELAYYADGLALPFLLLMSLLGLAAILSSLDRPLRGSEKNRLYAASFFLLAAGFSLVLSANLITLCLSWVLLDLGVFLLIRLQGGGLSDAARAGAINGVAGMAVLAAAVVVSQSEASFSLIGGLVPPLALSLLTLAALVRVGLYPLHLGLPLTEGRPWAEALYRLIPASAGAYLLLRTHTLAREAIPTQGILILLGCLAMVVSAILAWAEARRSRALSWVAVNQVSCVVLAMGMDTPEMAILALLQAINLALAMGLLFLGQGMGSLLRRETLVVWLLCALALASLLGLPPTLGFVARWAFYRHVIEGGAWLLLLLSVVSNALILAPLLSRLRLPTSLGRDELISRITYHVSRIMYHVSRITRIPLRSTCHCEAALFRRSNPQVATWRLLRLRLAMTALGLLGLPIVVLGVQPRLLAPFVRPVGGAAARVYLGQVISSVSLLLGLGILIAILLPLLLGYGLHRARQVIAARGQVLLSRICSWMELTWLYRLLWRGALRLGTALGSLMALLEGRYALAWIALLALVVVLLILGG